MTISIIGSGNVGTALARQFARSGLPVGIANTRGTASLESLVAELGGHVIAQSLQDAGQADIVILAVPFRAHRDIGALSPDWSGRIVVDAMNPYGVAPGELEDRPSSVVVADAFPGARLVKTFNQLPAKLLAADPSGNGGRRVMFVAGNDAAANTEISDVVTHVGFAPIVLGRLDQGGALLGIDGPLILQNLIRQDATASP